MWLQMIVAAVPTSAAVAAALVWLTQNFISERLKNAIKHEYDAKLEIHKAQLQIVNLHSVEQLKSDLGRAAYEHQIRFSRLHEKTAAVIAETYEKLVNLDRAIRSYTKPLTSEVDGPLAERREKLNDAFADFYRHFLPRQIFLPKETAVRVRKFAEEVFDTAQNFADYIEDGVIPGEKHTTWSATVTKVRGELKEFLDLIEEEFRQRLGVIVEGDEKRTPKSVGKLQVSSESGPPETGK